MIHTTRIRGSLAELLVAYRFLEQGRLPSWPLVSCGYDLIVDGGNQRFRVQVKQARLVGLSKTRWGCRLTKNRKKDQGPQAVRDVDYLCVVTVPDQVYVIPVQACTSPTDRRWIAARLEIGPESKYRVFLNRFAIGDGRSDEIEPVPIYTKPLESLRKMPQYRVGRKRHRRLTLEQIQEISKLPIRWYGAQSSAGTVTLAQVAEQFDVSPATIRNTVFFKKRQDVRRALVSAE